MRISTTAALVPALLLGAALVHADLSGLSDVGSSTDGTFGRVVAKDLPRFEPIRDTLVTEEIGVVFVVEDVHAAYDDKLSLAVYILNPADVRKNFAVAQLNLSAWYYTDPGVSVYTGETVRLNVEARAYDFLRPEIDLSAVAYNSTYTIRAQLMYQTTTAGGAAGPNPFVLRCEIKQGGAL